MSFERRFREFGGDPLRRRAVLSKIFVFEMCRKHQISAIHGGCEYRVITSTLGARVYDAVRSRHWLSPALEANMRNRSLNQIALVGTFALLSTTVSYGDSAHLPRASYIKCLYQANGQILCKSTDVIKSLLDSKKIKQRAHNALAMPRRANKIPIVAATIVVFRTLAAGIVATQMTIENLRNRPNERAGSVTKRSSAEA